MKNRFYAIAKQYKDEFLSNLLYVKLIFNIL